MRSNDAGPMLSAHGAPPQSPPLIRNGHVLRMVKFMLVGVSGLVVNTLALALISGVGHLHYLVGVVLATQLSTTWNFALTGAWVFARDENHQFDPLTRYTQFLAINNVLLVLRGPMMVVLTALGMHYLAANAVSLVITFAVRYAAADGWIWKPSPSGDGPLAADGHMLYGTPRPDVKLCCDAPFSPGYSPESCDRRRGSIGRTP